MWDSLRFTPAQFVSIARMGIERFLCTGFGSGGWYYEGHGYIQFATVSGVFQVVQALRNTLGIDLARSTGLQYAAPLTVQGMVRQRFPKYGPHGGGRAGSREHMKELGIGDIPDKAEAQKRVDPPRRGIPRERGLRVGPQKAYPVTCK